MKYWRTKKRKALRAQIIILFVLPNALGKLYLNLNGPKGRASGLIKVRPQVI